MEELEKIIAHLEQENARLAAANPYTKASLSIVEEFIKKNDVMCYGGTAINNLLPKKEQFYDPELDIPDYDFFSKNPQEHAMKLADELARIGVKNVEVKPGMHLGTFKVFADFEGIADITHLDPIIFDRLWKDSITKDGIHYVPPNFLRMSMYLELSRPKGDVSRWKKVYSRLQLLNQYYPLSCPGVPEKVELESERNRKIINGILKKYDVVLLGITASQYHQSKAPKWSTPVSILAKPEDIPKITAKYETKTYPGSDILPGHTDILDTNDNVYMRIHETTACHSYHQTADGIKIASIPTTLQFFFAYMYSGIDNTEISHLLCVSQRLMDLANHKEKRRYALLTPIDCLGEQETLVDMRKNKAVLYDEVSKNRNSSEFLKFFFTYDPHISKTERKKVKDKLRKTRKARIESSY